MKTPTRGRAFTLVELLVIVVVLGLIALVLLPALSRPRHGYGRHIKDSTQVRGIHQAMVLWAQNNGDRYPLPSRFDKDNTTVDAAPEAKDTTANIISILIYTGFFSPELCVSPAEVHPNIRIFDKYQYSEPTGAGASDKKLALWDPGFIADFTGKEPGGLSYGHALPHGARLEDWSNTFKETQAVLGNRGPQIASVTRSGGTSVTPNLLNPSSNTLKIHGGRDSWEGNIGYNDNHVNFETSMTPEITVYLDKDGKQWPDVLFYEEPDHPTGRDNFLGIYTASGKERKDWTMIWD